jgi:hypothetical protein
MYPKLPLILLVFFPLLPGTLYAKPPVIKGDRTYKQNEPIVLKATEVTSKSAQFLWDVGGAANAVEAGDTLYIWAPPGSYTVRLTTVDFEAKKVERTSYTFNVEGKAPDPKPPTPPNPPGPTPGPTTGLRVLILYESADAAKIPLKQNSILYGAEVRKWLQANCADSPDKTHKEWGIFDKDDDISAYSPKLQEMKNRPRTSLPWLVIAGDSGVVFEGPLPADVPSMMSLLQKTKMCQAKARKAS